MIKDEDIRECYVFEDPDDPRCPTILHFPLINKTFKDYVAPGKVEFTKMILFCTYSINSGVHDVTNVTWRHFWNSVWNLILIDFFKYSTGVPRETQEEKDFANFSIFDDPEEPYSSFKFHYDHQTFDRLHELMKFNTLLNVDLIKEKIASQVLRRWNNKEITLR